MKPIACDECKEVPRIKKSDKGYYLFTCSCRASEAMILKKNKNGAIETYNALRKRGLLGRRLEDQIEGLGEKVDSFNIRCTDCHSYLVGVGTNVSGFITTAKSGWKEVVFPMTKKEIENMIESLKKAL